jgi:hypothetical protein
MAFNMKEVDEQIQIVYEFVGKFGMKVMKSRVNMMAVLFMQLFLSWKLFLFCTCLV